jgi:hypothetical protein
MFECKYLILLQLDMCILIMTTEQLSLIIILIFQVLIFILYILNYVLSFVYAGITVYSDDTIHTSVFYIPCIWFLPDDGSERVETSRR